MNKEQFIEKLEKHMEFHNFLANRVRLYDERVEDFKHDTQSDVMWFRFYRTHIEATHLEYEEGAEFGDSDGGPSMEESEIPIEAFILPDAEFDEYCTAQRKKRDNEKILFQQYLKSINDRPLFSIYMLGGKQ